MHFANGRLHRPGPRQYYWIIKKAGQSPQAFMTPTVSLAFRVCISDGNEQLSEKWAKNQLQRAYQFTPGDGH
jgi:hypothetical protein